jgi:hypothetical protein
MAAKPLLVIETSWVVICPRTTLKVDGVFMASPFDFVSERSARVVNETESIGKNGCIIIQV